MIYGHSVLKLLNAQYYLDHQADLDLIVLVPRHLRWMVPDGVAAIWTVGSTGRGGGEWNDWLARAIKERLGGFPTCWLSVVFSHLHPNDYAIERFTRVRPFSVEEWQRRLSKPTVTFIWREDRLWSGAWWLPGLAGQAQQGRMVSLAEALRRQWPSIDFAVVGIGRRGPLPGWIRDLRAISPAEETERRWCERYAESHIVIGVHGSNMLLPSAHAGAVVELVPRDRWGNLLQDILFCPGDLRETMFRVRLLPVSIRPVEVALVVSSLLRDHQNMVVTMRREYCDHGRDGGSGSVLRSLIG